MLWPVVVKPASSSTIGVTIVRKPAQWRDALALARRFDVDAMVEAYIPGHEVTVDNWEAPCFSIGAPRRGSVAPGGFYDFAAKYEKGNTQYLCPAPLTATVTLQIRDLGVAHL